MTDDLARKMYLAETAVVREHLADQTTPLRDRIAAALMDLGHPQWDAAEGADAVLAVLPATTDRAELTAEEARSLADDLGLQLYRAQDALAFVAECCTIAEREQRAITTADVRKWLKGAQCGRQLAAGAAELRRMADETQPAETEAEKLAKAARMAKAMSAPPVRPPEWATTTEWPGRHKRPGDRRVHATAPFVVNDSQRIWTACGEPVGRGGTPLSHMPVDCRGCKRATAAGARQDGADRG